LARVIGVVQDRKLPSKDGLLRIFVGVVRNELPVLFNHDILWGRIEMGGRSVVL
jgi:hypothetical protein